jgi:hypothetical protein
MLHSFRLLCNMGNTHTSFVQEYNTRTLQSIHLWGHCIQRCSRGVNISVLYLENPS